MTPLILATLLGLIAALLLVPLAGLIVDEWRDGYRSSASVLLAFFLVVLTAAGFGMAILLSLALDSGIAS